jgi:hypothetical protein
VLHVNVNKDSAAMIAQGQSDLMTSDVRIATRHVFEARILIRLRRDSQSLVVSGWARDLSESGLGAFVAEGLVVGESV